MKIKCTKVNNQEGINEALTLGKNYVVLAIEIYSCTSAMVSHESENIYYRIENDDNQVLLYPAFLFEQETSKIPRCWVIRTGKDGSLNLEHKSWDIEFLDDFYNYEPNAMNLYEATKLEIFAEEDN